ncbi:MAG: hypothetical protein IKX21_01765 [Deltaproteobacteria bacterium]|nr:hypothetical protein [Deltaproteobacteria bacterium]
MKFRDILRSVLAGSALILTLTTLHAETLSFADITWSDNKDTVLVKLKKQGITVEIDKEPLGSYAVLHVLSGQSRDIPKIEEFYKQVVEPIDFKTEVKIRPTHLKTGLSKPENQIVKGFMAVIADVGPEVPLYYYVRLVPEKAESVLEVLEGKYGKFKDLPAILFAKVRKYAENGNEFLIYWYSEDAAGSHADLYFFNLDNIRRYVPAKLEQLKAQKASSDDAAKKAAKDLF